MKVAVIGSGSWGTAIAKMLGENYSEVMLWARSSSTAEEIQKTRYNLKYLPEVFLPPSIQCTNDLAKVVEKTDIVVIATPSHAVRQTSQEISRLLANNAVIVTAAKGFEVSTLKRMSEVISEEIPRLSSRIAVLSGPNHAEEVGMKYPTTSVVAAASRNIAEIVQDALMLPYFRVYTNPDVIGVELGGALKNIIALGAGVAEGLGFGDNTKAALMTRGLTEITRLGVALGAKNLTFAGLSGIGDLMVTCTSRHSRNRRAGLLLAQGKSMQEIEKETSMVVEGIRATFAARELARIQGIEMPITEQIYSVIYDGKPAKEAVLKLMTRERTHEVEEIVTESSWN